MFAEIGRVLRAGGRYCCVTLAQAHVLRWLLAFFGNSKAWGLEIIRLAATPESPLCPFLVVATKGKDGTAGVQIVDDKYHVFLPQTIIFDLLQHKHELLQWKKSRIFCRRCNGWIL